MSTCQRLLTPVCSCTHFTQLPTDPQACVSHRHVSQEYGQCDTEMASKTSVMLLQSHRNWGIHRKQTQIDSAGTLTSHKRKLVTKEKFRSKQSRKNGQIEGNHLPHVYLLEAQEPGSPLHSGLVWSDLVRAHFLACPPTYSNLQEHLLSLDYSAPYDLTLP